MISEGKIVESDTGKCIRVGGHIKAGGQGIAYWATEIDSGQTGVLKVFNEQFANVETVKRLRFLVDQDLQSKCPALCAPVEVFSMRNFIAHYAPYAEGQPLEEFLVNPNSTFIEEMQLAIALAHSINLLHQHKFCHGDLHAENLIINRIGSTLQLQLIDFDNFNAPGMPPPPCVGHNLYMAPGLREALANGEPAVPSIHSDLFSLGVLMHEILLLCHPSAGNDENEADFHKAMCSGRWLLDPAVSDVTGGAGIGGYPPTVLNADLARLFRFAVSVEPTMRPSADKWEAELGKAFNTIYCCPKCGGPCVIDVSKTTCPLCDCQFPYLTLRINNHVDDLPLKNGSTIVGRTQLSGSMKVSARHAVFRRIGPETWIESTGSNGTYRWNGSGWIRLPDRKPMLVQKGDRLRLGDVEIQMS